MWLVACEMRAWSPPASTVCTGSDGSSDHGTPSGKATTAGAGSAGERRADQFGKPERIASNEIRVRGEVR
jgi:hypothetical protein